MPFIPESQINIMMVEWFKKRYQSPPRISPKDKVTYVISDEAINYTIKILLEYERFKPSAEGLVYWAGHVENDIHYVTAAVAPRTDASRYGIFTSHDSNARFVEFLCDSDLIYIAQVHSHPGDWVDHSVVDNEETAFRSEGLVSVVVPCFGRKGMLPVSICGIHRYAGGKFIRLSNKYLKTHVIVKNMPGTILKDLRYEK